MTECFSDSGSRMSAHRRFVSALAIDAVGSGIWMPLSLLYFLHQTSLSLVHLGAAMTIANVAVLAVVPAIGSLVDRLGPKIVMQAGNAGAAVAFVLYPFAHSMAAVAVLVFAAAATRFAFWGALGPMVTQITERGERELWFGFLQAMRNAGYGVGGVLAAVALTVGSDAAFQSVVLLNAASYVLAFLLMLGVAGGGRVAAGETRSGGANRGWWVAFADRGYRWLIVVIFCYALAETTLNVAMPVYFIDTLDLPGWVPGIVFVINTVMIGVGQGLVVRSMTGLARRRVLHAAVAFSAVSFVLLYAAGALSVTTGVIVVLVGAVVFTLGEMTAGPVVAALSAEAPPPEQRGRFMAATQLAWGASGAVAPLLFTALLHRGALWLWGGAIVLCALWALTVEVMARRMPLARGVVTNVAESATADPVAEAPTTP
jgi:MFS family permease